MSFSSPKSLSEKRNYLVIGCGCNEEQRHPGSQKAHPKEKWVTIDRDSLAKPDYVFEIGTHSPEILPKPEKGYQVIFSEGLPPFVMGEAFLALLKTHLAEEGVLVIDNCPDLILDLMKINFTGEFILSPGHTLVITKNLQVDLDKVMKNKDLERMILPIDFPYKKYSNNELKISSSREIYKTLVHYYDICREYKTHRWNRTFRNFFRDDTYSQCLDRITNDIKKILEAKTTEDPQKILLDLKKFIQKHITDKTFPNTVFSKVKTDRDHATQSERDAKKTTLYGYDMNQVLSYGLLYCDYTHQLALRQEGDFKKNYTGSPTKGA